MYYPHSTAKNIFRSPKIWHHLSLNRLLKAGAGVRDARRPNLPAKDVHPFSLGASQS